MLYDSEKRFSRVSDTLVQQHFANSAAGSASLISGISYLASTDSKLITAHWLEPQCSDYGLLIGIAILSDHIGVMRTFMRL